MKQINKTLMFNLKEFFDFSSIDELMKNLKEFKCKRNLTCNYDESLQKDEFYFVLKKNNSFHVVLDNTLLTFSSEKSKNAAFIYDYFITEQQLRKEKLFKIQQVSSNLIY